MTEPIKLETPVQTDGPSVNELLAEMKAAGSDEMDFHVHRDDPEPGVTFSREALEDVDLAMRTFIAARLAARFDGLKEGDPGPTDMHIAVKLTIDGETFEIPTDLRPWYAVDGSHRRGGTWTLGR